MKNSIVFFASIIIFLISMPLFLVYIFLCLIIPIIKIGKKQNVKNGTIFYVIKDHIHADYLFEANTINKLFKTNKKYVIVGWGDRKIFLETKKWSDLLLADFLKAFYGLNKTVLRVEFTNNIPKNKKIKMYKTKNISKLFDHIKESFINKKINKKKEYNQKGKFYESSLKYNCFFNCNNWINRGLIKCGSSCRFWSPLSFWL